MCHEGPGLDDHARSRAARLADELGYAAFALDYHGGGAISPRRPPRRPASRMFIENPVSIRARLRQALEVLLAQPEVDALRIAAIGYCFGGTAVLELARSGAPIAATVGFHSGLKTVRPTDARNIKGKVLVCLRRRRSDDSAGGSHGIRGRDARRRGRLADASLRRRACTRSPTRVPARSTCPGIAYDEPADRRSWQAMGDLFGEVFG